MATIIKRLKQNIDTDAILSITSSGTSGVLGGKNITITANQQGVQVVNLDDDINITSITSPQDNLTINKQTKFLEGIHTEQDIVLETRDTGRLTHLHQDATTSNFEIRNYNGDIQFKTPALLEPLSVKAIETGLQDAKENASSFVERFLKIEADHKLTINPLEKDNWNNKILAATLDTSDTGNGTIIITPTTYDATSVNHDIAFLKTQIDQLYSNLEGVQAKEGLGRTVDISTRAFQGQYNSNNNKYGYVPQYGEIPLWKSRNEITFGDLFNVDYNEWDGILYDDKLIKWGTKTDTIDLSNKKFKATVALPNIVLFKRR